MFTKTYGGSKESVTEVLNFARTLEYLENEFYKEGLVAAGLIPADRKVIFNQVSKHEASHVAFLKSAISSMGATPVSKPTFDFTAGGTYADVFTNYQTFLALSQVFEDTGVRAYKGRAAELIGNDACNCRFVYCLSNLKERLVTQKSELVFGFFYFNQLQFFGLSFSCTPGWLVHRRSRTGSSFLVN